ncbi:hypothetical protein [Cellulomonas sp. WB94]|uniref:hypothetical protein n=1 Tax=Cellulomonas sp. WB94 TaxID=2173174 RepID=UPI001304E7CF|nr:hypothetical protein [Cellulomonas sp. WB94]
MDQRGTAGSYESPQAESGHPKPRIPVARVKSWAQVAANRDARVGYVPAQREYAGAA